MIEFTHEHLKSEFELNLSPKLRDVILRLDAYCYARGLKRVVVTRILNDAIGSPDSRGDAIIILIGSRYSAEEFGRIVEFLETEFPRFEKDSTGRTMATTSVEGYDDLFCLKIVVDKT